MADEFTPIETQEQLDQLIKGRIERARAREAERYADYDELKAKAEEYDKAREAAKTEMEKANERIKALEDAARVRDEADERRTLLDRVSKATGVPANLLSGDTEEELTASADAVNAYVQLKAPGYPADKGGGANVTPEAERKGIESIRDPAARVRARAKHIDLYR